MPDRGSFVVVVGPDGSGKTTFAQAIVDRLGNRSRYFHFLPRPLWHLADMPGTPGELVAKFSGHGSVLGGWVRLVRNLAKAWLAYWMAVRPALRRGVTVVGDRYLYGYLVQPTPLKFFGPDWIAHGLLKLIPSPDLVVVLDAPTPIIRDRKPELSIETIDGERTGWPTVAPNTLVLDSTKPPPQLVDELFAALRLPTRGYPPGIGHVVIPGRPRISGLQGTSLYGPNKRGALLLHRAARIAIGAAGTGWLPSVGESELPLGVARWANLLAGLGDRGLSVDRIALHRRTQKDRTGFSVLTLGYDGPTAFVRVNSPGTDREIEVLGHLSRSLPQAFEYPTLLFEGCVGEDRFAAFEPILSGFHQPVSDPPIALIAEEISAALEGLPKPHGTLPHWRPMHGDFTPWNLRREGERLVLIDWEDAGWGPPNADLTLYWAASQAVGLRPPQCTPSDEAALFWLDRLPAEVTGRDERLKVSIELFLRSVVN